MKKRILLLVIVLCGFLCSCGKSNSLLIEEDGLTCINYDKFSEIIEPVELTKENWKDYIKFYSYEEKIIETDDFGEIVSTEIITHYSLGAGNERYHQFQDAVLELKNKETGELTIYNFGHQNEIDVDKGFDLDNYECTRIKGILYFVDLPKEVLYSPLKQWDYDTGFMVCSRNSQTPYRVNSGSKGIGHNGSFENYLK